MNWMNVALDYNDSFYEVVISGKKSFENSGAKSEINKALADFKVTYFNDFFIFLLK